jgi:hypothetical protein
VFLGVHVRTLSASTANPQASGKHRHWPTQHIDWPADADADADQRQRHWACDSIAVGAQIAFRMRRTQGLFGGSGRAASAEEVSRGVVSVDVVEFPAQAGV